MRRILTGLAAGLALGLLLAFGLRSAFAGPSTPPTATPAASQESAGAEPPLLRLGFADRTPMWRTINLEDKVPALLVRVPEGQRFVLTDLWLLAHERLPATVGAGDRMWLECVTGDQRQVVFDQRVGELEPPMRWETGVAFGPGQEAWAAYLFADDKVKRPRRVHFTGYFEPIDPLEILVQLTR